MQRPDASVRNRPLDNGEPAAHVSGTIAAMAPFGTMREQRRRCSMIGTLEAGPARMTVRAALRAATQASHERVDALFSRFDLTDPEQYGLFLAAQASAHLPVEEALDAGGIERILTDWPDRRRAALLRDDLAAAGYRCSPRLPVPVFDGAPALLGGAYVLEGSRLGGIVLGRSLPPSAPGRFLRASGRSGAWRHLLATMDELIYDAADLASASEAAEAVFSMFEQAGRRVWDDRTRG